MRPLVSRTQLEKCRAMWLRAWADGGRLVCGGEQTDFSALKDGSSRIILIISRFPVGPVRRYGTAGHEKLGLCGNKCRFFAVGS